LRLFEDFRRDKNWRSRESTLDFYLNQDNRKGAGVA